LETADLGGVVVRRRIRVRRLDGWGDDACVGDAVLDSVVI
jgi:hypothetical protein